MVANAAVAEATTTDGIDALPTDHPGRLTTRHVLALDKHQIVGRRHVKQRLSSRRSGPLDLPKNL